jgi:hypothetical protein
MWGKQKKLFRERRYVNHVQSATRLELNTTHMVKVASRSAIIRAVIIQNLRAESVVMMDDLGPEA